MKWTVAESTSVSDCDGISSDKGSSDECTHTKHNRHPLSQTVLLGLGGETLIKSLSCV